MTVSDLLDKLDVQELAEWMAFVRLQANPNAFTRVDDQLKEAFRSICGRR